MLTHRREGSLPPAAVRAGQGLVFALAAILPIAHTTALRNTFFWSAFVLTAFAVAWWRLKPVLPVPLAWLAYAAAAAASIPFALDATYSAGEFKAEVVYCAIAMTLGATWIRDEESLAKLLALLVGITAISSAWGLAEASLYLASGKPIGDMVVSGTHTGMGTYSTYLVSVAPLAMAMAGDQAGRRRALGMVTLALMLGALLVTRNRIGMVVLMVETLVFLWLMRKRLHWTPAARLMFIAALAIMTAVFFWQLRLRADTARMASVESLEKDPRWEIYARGWKTLSDHPWTGVGFGRRSFTYANREYVASQKLFWHAHNVILNKGVQMGWPGIAAFVLLMTATAMAFLPRNSRRRVPDHLDAISACAITMLVGSMLKNMTDDFFVRDHALLFWLLAGAFVSTIRTGASRRGSIEAASGAAVPPGQPGELRKAKT